MNVKFSFPFQIHLEMHLVKTARSEPFFSVALRQNYAKLGVLWGLKKGLKGRNSAKVYIG